DTIRTRTFDEAIIFGSFHQNPLPLALLLRFADVTLISAICPDYPGSLLDVRHNVADDIHEVERNLSLAAAAGYRLPGGDDGTLAIRPPSSGPATSLRHSVVVHPGASVAARAWDPLRMRTAVSALAAEGRAVAVTGSPAETQLTAAVAGQDATDLGGRTDLAQLAQVIAHADVVVTGNTGPAHLAAAVGTPVVSLYAPTVPASRWRPWMVPHLLLGDQEIGCAGCRARRCPLPVQLCLEGVTAADVKAAVDWLTLKLETT
ncbi:MAG TPA: glycosyltransferase family 9 protein, partial [Mycobacterium sp.]|nr:glycosyltransferase family 9 protein [Mycobacterium sp.]